MILKFGVDNTAKVFLNGVMIADVSHFGCADVGNYTILLPPGVLRRGENLLVVLATDDGSANFFDMQLTADLATSSGQKSWGRLKVHHD